MAELIRKTEATFFGPWLLDSAALAALDEIIDEQWLRLEAHRKHQVAKEVRRQRDRLRKYDSPSEQSEDDAKAKERAIRKRVEEDYTYPGDGRTITLTLSSGNKVRVNSFREASTDVTCRDHYVTQIELQIRHGDIRADLVVPRHHNKHGLSLIALPQASSQADELFVRLHEWCEQHKPDWFRRLWGLGPGLLTIFGFMICSLAFALAVLLASVSNSWKDEVRTLTAKGIQPEDYGRALQLLLEKSAGLNTQRVIFDPPNWIVPAAITAVIAVLFLSIYPASTVFAIGKGAASVRRQSKYEWFLRKTVPAFLIMGVLASVLGSWLYDLRPR